MLRLSEGRKAYPSGSSSSSPFPPGVLPPFPEPLSALYLKASFSWPSRLIWALLNSPVARARSFSPFTLLARVNSAAEAAPLADDAYGEDGEVVQFHVFAVQNKFFGTGNHVGEHPFD